MTTQPEPNDKSVSAPSEPDEPISDGLGEAASDAPVDEDGPSDRAN